METVQVVVAKCVLQDKCYIPGRMIQIFLRCNVQTECGDKSATIQWDSYQQTREWADTEKVKSREWWQFRGKFCGVSDVDGFAVEH
jgi:hypothetical protein